MNRALQLWLRWFEQDGAPYIKDGEDMGYDDYCFFCGENEPEHEPDCIYLEAEKLVQEAQNEAEQETHS